MGDPIEILNLRLAAGAIDQTAYDSAVAALRAGRQSSIVPVPSPETNAHRELYAIYRDYIKHEDDLTNQRLGWNLAIQGFLFSAFAFVFQKTAELWNALSLLNNAAKFPMNIPNPAFVVHGLIQLNGILFLLALVGFFITAIVAFGTNAARLAITTLQTRWNSLHPEYGVSTGKPNTHSPDHIGLPGILGGGNPDAVTRGFRVAPVLPWLLMGIWALLASNSFREIYILIVDVAAGQNP